MELDHYLIIIIILIILFYFNLTSQYYKLMKSFLSLLSERREMRASEKCHPGFGCGIEPRSSRTEGVCATDAPLHILTLHYIIRLLFLAMRNYNKSVSFEMMKWDVAMHKKQLKRFFWKETMISRWVLKWWNEVSQCIKNNWNVSFERRQWRGFDFKEAAGRKNVSKNLQRKIKIHKKMYSKLLNFNNNIFLQSSHQSSIICKHN